MSGFSFSEDDLKCAAEEVHMTMLASLPSSAECVHEFSPSFQRKMKRLIRRANHPVRYSVLKAAACFLLVMLLAGCSVLAFSSEAREVFFGWTKRVYENFFEYSYTGENAALPEHTTYRPTWIPDGYAVVYELYNEAAADIFYQNKTGDLLHFHYSTFDEGTDLHIVGVDVEARQTYVGKWLADLYLEQDAENSNALVWADEEKKVLFQISAPISGDELIKIAESIESVQTAEVYVPTWLPDDFEIFHESYRVGDVKVSYMTKDGHLAHFLYTSDSEGSILGGTGESEHQQVYVGDHPADLYIDKREDENNALIWHDEERQALFSIFAPLSGDDLVQIAESIEPAQLTEIYMPTWVPDGLIVSSESKPEAQTIGIYTKVYSDEEGRIILAFSCARRNGSVALNIESGGVDVQQVSVHGRPADLYLDSDVGETNIIVWADEDADLLFWITGLVSGEELIRIAESVEPVNRVLKVDSGVD